MSDMRFDRFNDGRYTVPYGGAASTPNSKFQFLDSHVATMYSRSLLSHREQPRRVAAKLLTDGHNWT